MNQNLKLIRILAAAAYLRMTEEEQNKPNIKEKAEEKPEVGEMKRGDYMIHVFIEQARQLKTPGGATADPIIEVTCMQEKKFTSTKDDVGSTGVINWQEHLFFEPKNVSIEQIECAKISIRVLDKGFFKEAVIGAYDFDIAYIYFMKRHTMFHQWIALSDPESANFDEVAGFLKLSVSVACTGDEQVQITEDEGGEKDDEESVLMPASIKPKFYQLKFRFFQAQNLPVMDAAILGTGGSIDAYISCQSHGQKLKTRTVTMKDKIVNWNQEFLIPCQLPIMSSRLVMKLFDEDKFSDEVAGSIIFDVKEVLQYKNGLLLWKNIYGAPQGEKGDCAKLMNSNPEVASTWKGRILMQVIAEDTEKPLIKVQNLDQQTVDLASPYLKPHEFDIIAEVGNGISLPTSSKYTVKLTLAEFELQTPKPQIQENNFNRWNHRFQDPQQTVVRLPYQDIYDIGRVYIYLMDGHKPVCFSIQKVSQFMDPNPKKRWIELQPDLSIAKVTEPHKAGIVSFKISIHDRTKNGPADFKQYKAWKKPPPKRPCLQKVRAYIFQCRNLPAADSNGSSDPYIKVWDTSKKEQQTSVIKQNTNPLFYETLELMYESNSIEDMPPFVFDIYDKDFNPLDPDDFIGRALIPITEASYSEDNEIPQPKWHACRLKQGGPSCGEVLASFSIVTDDFNFKIPLSYVSLVDTVQFNEYVVKITVLGLRDLQSVGFLPVKKAFVIFNIKSLIPPNCSQAIKNAQTQIGPAGPNPTINTLVEFSVPLPGNPLYCPKLQCSVFDNIFKGFSQPLLGTFTIPVGEALFQQQKEREEDLANIDHILSELDKIAKGIGVVSYNVQIPSYEVEDSSFRKIMTKEKETLRRSLSGSSKGSTKQEETQQTQLFKPLLLNLDEDELEGDSKIDDFNADLSKTPKKTAQKTSLDNAGLNKVQKTNPLQASSLKFDRFASGLKKKLIEETKLEESKGKREVEAEQQRQFQDFKRTCSSPFTNIIRPVYSLDSRLNVLKETESSIPPPALFMALGWDEAPEDQRKHYRRYYQDELENVKDVMPVLSPFDQYEIMRGQSRGASQTWWPFGSKKTDESGSTSTEQVVGRFKGLIEINSIEQKTLYNEQKEQRLHDLKVKLNSLSLRKTSKPLNLDLEKICSLEDRMQLTLLMENLGVAHLQITKHLVSMTQGDNLRRLLLCKTKCKVRVYMISAYDLASRDSGSPSDPYLYIQLGNKIYNERKNYITDEPNPDFHKYFEFESVFPGCAPLNIGVYDYDDLFGDDLIGETKIDLEDRFFCAEWQALKDKPIEYRQLYRQSSTMSQGVVKCWVEILPSNACDEVEIFQIQPKPPEKYEVRVVVFDTQDIKMMDVEGASDVYIRSFFDSKEQVKETDTHFRCTDGKASFNYRLLLQTMHPRKDWHLTIQAYDKDIFSSNDLIGESRVNLKLAFQDAALAKRPISINKKYYNSYLKQHGVKLNFKDDLSFWVNLTTKNEKGKVENTGRVRVQIDILPIDLAEMNKVGEARNEPNVNPFLPPPFGRLSLDINPLKMISQMVGPALRRKIYLYCCLTFCMLLIIMMFPLVFSNIIASLINPLD